MKRSLMMIGIVVLLVTSCAAFYRPQNLSAPLPQTPGGIYLYGEEHGNESILQRELELWSGYYHENGIRHLFVELPYYTAEFLNLWMRADTDAILNALYADWSGSASHNEYVLAFYKGIKAQCPETIFHGTDVGHQHDTTGVRYLEYLSSMGQQDSEAYRLAQAVIEQGKRFYRANDYAYRETAMVDNFIREFDKLNGKSIMGIYGSAHTGLQDNAYRSGIPSMANYLRQRYGDGIYTENLSLTVKNTKPLRMDEMTVGGKTYQAAYFGAQDISKVLPYEKREFWRLENAYEDFQAVQTTDNVLPYDNYPMKMEAGQMFVIDYTKPDGSVKREIHRADGDTWNGKPVTRELKTP